ncbi:undecaprenyl/decaprenyl-phosphate alpha-N-acetylglucosaminyl 1-phosphate transferase [Antarcticibacterium sp. 1MA-6-2]|uniref:MraY family glycosyltransferase n=1 Tax=Antarcticibacterium sp. 1MA-6-2 TaxID=2908210 RepID=UPI001F2F7672|nr:MraY family glycosyltransferase [Antarcticibacterium sp. 1MA-6-2]UJH89857.1 undecaprenyl/decaprenyl-phosphate alpha-N-acetylglucosaminyl 1-phosphate transferase [Antarcticibacterium sp. 1MA-6-2]
MNILDQETIVELFRTYNLLFIGGLFLIAFCLTYYLIPKVLWVSKEKNLMAQVNDRSSHSTATPSFGGVAFYVTLILLLTTLQTLRLTYVGNHLIAAITILFMVGIKDDLVISTARVKLFGQLAAICFLIFSPEMQLSNLHGFWGIYEIPVLMGYAINAVIAIALINAYNLIDGIDGLASMVGIVIAGVYAGIFYTTGNSYFVLVSTGLVGILTAFMRFNFSRGRKKIFMGDSGSLVIGLILAFLTIKVLVMAPQTQILTDGHIPANRLLLIASVLFIPAFDTLRVIVIRLLDKRSPFSADRNHAHHILLDLGMTHFRASFSLAMYNLLVISSYFYLSTKLSNLWLTFVVVFMYSLTFLVVTRLKIITDREAKPTHTTVPRMEGIKIERVEKVKKELVEAS